jgi:hypothetical protein
MKSKYLARSAKERITNEFTNFIARLSTSNRTIIINNNRW